MKTATELLQEMRMKARPHITLADLPYVGKVSGVEERELRNRYARVPEKCTVMVFEDKRMLVLHISQLEQLIEQTGSDRLSDWVGRTVAIEEAPHPRTNVMMKAIRVVTDEVGEVTADDISFDIARLERGDTQ
jgi:hypothetical protein